MKTLKEYIVEGLLDRVKNKEVNHEDLIRDYLKNNYACKQNNYNIEVIDGKYIVNVDGNIMLKNRKVKHLTNGLFEFGEVKGDFMVSSCDIIDFIGGPKEVYNGDLSIQFCDDLESLEGCPKIVYNSFEIHNCPNLKSFEGAPEEIKWGFYCRGCYNITKLKGFPKKVGSNCVFTTPHFDINDIKRICKAEYYEITKPLNFIKI